MNIQAEKVELIKLITEIDSEQLLKKIRKVVSSFQNVEAEKNAVGPVMTKRLKESKKQIEAGKGTKVSLDDIWK